ncbi:tyrosine-type recombinase/integrase [Martelella soudanensis]|uniref:tyrosine-type recombinase/integrase n=1 Tax=unclassified Martelella TaxID=2629616 RepID=UPI001FEDDEA4|nr:MULTISPECIES: tyrosine-type recombinase/integrase [unclassified Martelella]
MKIHMKGLMREVLPSGAIRWRVRPEGRRTVKITLSCGPDDEDFHRQYLAARRGEKPEPLRQASDYAKPRSIAWLVNLYLEHLQKRIEAGTASPKTLKKKKNLLARLLATPDKVMLIPQERLIAMQDAMAATPAQAHAFVEAVAVMYDWAIKRKLIGHNPARGIDKVYVKGPGATPWKRADLDRYFAHHKKGSKAHIALSVLLWTGCRVEDLTILGRGHECVIDGYEALRWTPPKKGSSEVMIPLLAPLKQATRAATVQGATYVLGRGGKPFSSADSMSAMVKRWCADAGLPHLSAHGVRKGLSELLAELGVSQYALMSILGHSEAKTSEVYTRRVERWKLASDAMNRLTVPHTWL